MNNFDNDEVNSQNHRKNPEQFDQLSSMDATNNQVKLNSLEQRQLDNLFGGGSNQIEFEDNDNEQST